MRKLILFVLLVWGGQQAAKKAIESVWPAQTPREREGARQAELARQMERAAQEAASREWREGGRQEQALGGPPANVAPQASAGAAPVYADPRGAFDAAWRARIDAARLEVEAARRDYEGWQRHTLVPGYVLADKGTRRTVVPSVEALQARTRAAGQRLESAQRALADLEEQARRANVTPGALR